jgi:hypothetical protein
MAPARLGIRELARRTWWLGLVSKSTEERREDCRIANDDKLLQLMTKSEEAEAAR